MRKQTLSIFPIFLMSIFVMALALAACQGDAAESTPEVTDPVTLVAAAADLIRNAETFRMDVTQQGPDYIIRTVYADVFFRRANAQYVAPGAIQANLRVIAAGLPISIDVLSRGEDQWYRAIWTANQWVNEDFAAGFNAQSLIAEGTGFNAAINAVIDIEYMGDVTLESGVVTRHVSGEARGEDVNALLVGLIETAGTVTVDVYIDKETGYPVRFRITEENSPWAVPPSAGGVVEPIVWVMDIFDINQPAQLDEPDLATAEATAENAP